MRLARLGPMDRAGGLRVLPEPLHSGVHRRRHCRDSESERHQSPQRPRERSGVAAVYDGDDWQESVADFVINLVCCRFCRKAPKEIAIPFPTTV